MSQAQVFLTQKVSKCSKILHSLKLDKYNNKVKVTAKYNKLTTKT